MVQLTTTNLLQFVQEKGLSAEFQKETEQIAVILNIEGMQYPMFIRILTEGPVLQVLVFLPCSLNKNTLSDVSRLLHLLNKEMDVPGFGMDEAAGVIFYRVTVPALNGTVDDELLDTYLNSIQVICQSFTPVVINVTQGTMSFEAVLKKAQEEHQEDK